MSELKQAAGRLKRYAAGEDPVAIWPGMRDSVHAELGRSRPVPNDHLVRHFGTERFAAEDYETLAEWAAKMLDETALTPELLKQVGFTVVKAFDDGSGEHLKLGFLECVWETTRKGPYIGWFLQQMELKPRTLGELRMLCHRLEIELKE